MLNENYGDGKLITNVSAFLNFDGCTLSGIFGHEKVAYLEETTACYKFHTSDYLSVEPLTKAASCLYNRDHKLGKIRISLQIYFHESPDFPL